MTSGGLSARRLARTASHGAGSRYWRNRGVSHHVKGEAKKDPKKAAAGKKTTKK
jgi:hypothetical protein